MIVTHHHFNTDLEGAVTDQETRLTAAEENIQGILTIQKRRISSFYSKLILGTGKKLKESCVYLGLQMTDVELDERVTALEEGGGGGSPQNGTNNIRLSGGNPCLVIGSGFFKRFDSYF